MRLLGTEAYLYPVKLLKFFLYSFLLLLLVVFAVDGFLVYKTRGRVYSDLQAIPYNKTGLVLGTLKHDQEKRNEILEYYQFRIDATAALYHAGKISEVLISSGNTEYFDHNCDSIRADLLRNHIPADKIRIDSNGTRTISSIINAKQVFHLDGFTIITQKQHGKRALYMADHFGLHPLVYAASSDAKGFYPGAVFHEKAARFLMFYDLLRVNRD